MVNQSIHNVSVNPSHRIYCNHHAPRQFCSSASTQCEQPETWIENVAPTSDGKLLVTLINLPEVWFVNPVAHTASLAYTGPSVNVALGIAEVEHNVFADAAVDFSVP